MDKISELNFKYGEFLGQGTYGIIYQIDNNLACKIFCSAMFNNKNYSQVLMNIEEINKLPLKKATLPISFIVGFNQTIIGYTMPAILYKGTSKPRTYESVIKRKSLKNKLILLKEILIELQNIHNLDIIVGDFKPNNILLKDDKTIYFGDVDSFFPNKTELSPLNKYSLKYYQNFIRNSSYIHDKNVDMFIMGIIIIETMIGYKIPVEQLTVENIFEIIAKLDIDSALKEYIISLISDTKNKEYCHQLLK